MKTNYTLRATIINILSNNKPRWMSIKEIVKYLNIPYHTVYYYLESIYSSPLAERMSWMYAN